MDFIKMYKFVHLKILRKWKGNLWSRIKYLQTIYLMKVHNPAEYVISLSGIYTKEMKTYIHVEIFTWMLLMALFMKTKK